MIESKTLIGVQTVIELELQEKSDRTYILENGIVSHNCNHCKRFYVDADGSPAVYRLSTILGNGSNYGKRQSDWLPVSGATHPNDRESGLLELRNGWKISASGALEFIGKTDFQEYIVKKLRS